MKHLNLMPKLMLSFSPFVIGFMITMTLSGVAQIEIYDQIEEVKGTHLPALDRAQELLAQLEMVFIKLDDAAVRDPMSAQKSVRDAQEQLKQAEQTLTRLDALAPPELKHTLSELKGLTAKTLPPILSAYERLIIGHDESVSVDDLQWSLYQDFPPLRDLVLKTRDAFKDNSASKMDSVITQVTSLFERSAFTFVLVLFSSTLLVYLNLRRSIVRPLKTTVELLEQMSLGRLDQRLERPGRDEVGRMHAALNLFTEQLEGKVKHLKQISAGDLTTAVELTSPQDLLGEAMNEMQQSLHRSHLALTREAEEHRRSREALESAQAQLVQSEKMSSLGQLVAGVAHEINNPVNFLQSNFYAISQSLGEVKALLWEILPDDEEAREVRGAFEAEFQKIERYGANHQVGTRRLADIVSSLKSFTRHDQADIQRVEIGEIINDTLVILHNKVKKVSFDLSVESARPLYCHPSQLGQVLLNLISNALYETERTRGKEARVTVRAVDEGARIHLLVQDNGGGIPVEVQGKIFDPFFTTKPVGEGTGLGLSICYRIIESHKGELSFETGPQGTTFHVYVPFDALKAEFSS